MFDGRVDFRAKILDIRISFPLTTLAPIEDGIQNIEIECSDGETIRGTVRVTNVADGEQGLQHARSAMERTLNRLSFYHATAIVAAEVTASQFEPVEQV